MKELSERAKAILVDGIPESNLVLYCPGLQGRGGTLLDRSQQANHGTIIGATWVATNRGLRVLSFDGTSDYVDIGTPASLNLKTAFTFAAWVKGTWSGTVYMYGIINLGGKEMRIGDTTLAGKDLAQVAFERVAGGWAEIYGTTHLTAGVWYRISATYDQITLRLYVNGVQENSVAETANIVDSNN